MNGGVCQPQSILHTHKAVKHPTQTHTHTRTLTHTHTPPPPPPQQPANIHNNGLGGTMAAAPKPHLLRVCSRRPQCGSQGTRTSPATLQGGCPLGRAGTAGTHNTHTNRQHTCVALCCIVLLCCLVVLSCCCASCHNHRVQGLVFFEADTGWVSPHLCH